MAAEGMLFPWRWNGGTISLNLGVIWEMSVNHVVEGGPHKTKEELIAELESLRQRLGDLEQMVEGRENEDVPSEPFGDLNRIYREAPIGLCCLDTDLRFLQINDWMAAINGLSVEDHLGRTIGEVLPDVAAGVEAQFRRVLETGEPILEGTVEAETPARPGIRRTFQHNYYPLKSGDGPVVGVSCVVQDITERKQADKALKERYRRLLESTTAMPWEADARTWMFTYVGPQAVALLGYPRELWLEKDFWVDHIHPEDRAWVVDYCLKSSNQHENYEFEYRMIAADGRSVWLHDVVNVMRQDGAPVTLRGFMIDITERKRAGQARR
ncbi:MAG: PAS domain S-box protein, partial [Proteobacteria bacterium]|nr:PAS domain S-box protein [Pseudomonadota bacterium]